MRLQTVRTLLLDAAILAGLGAGGWFAGAAFLARDAGPAEPIVVEPETRGAATSDGTLVLPVSGLSPFGQHSGLPGRQLLVGRVTEVGEGFFVAATPAGPTTFTIDPESTFLLRLAPGSAADVAPGATVAVLAADGAGQDEGAPVVARTVLVLPAASRPQIQAPPPPAFDPGEAQAPAGEQEPAQPADGEGEGEGADGDAPG